MLKQVLSRLANMLLSVFGVAVLVFLLIHLVPGDPVEMMLGDYARPADAEALRQALGLDKPFWAQFGSYMGGLLQGDLGRSIHTGEPVSQMVWGRIPATAHLALTALLIAVGMAFPLGILAALKKDTPYDYGAMGVALAGISVPNFWLGQIMILLFALVLGWFPVSGSTEPFSVVLPAVTLGTGMAAILARMVRASLLEVMHEDYIRTARAKGVGERRVVWVHALRNALLPVITLIGMQMGALLAGAVITEKVFSWPGIGLLTVEAIQRRDYPLVQGAVLVISLSYVVINTLTDILYYVIDPRIRQSRHEV
jgi:peptide/nickel transport system permease protein